MTQLAAALWADAERLLVKAKERGLDSQDGRDLQRLIHARMKEADSMLVQVLREAPKMRLARIRLAHYLSIVDPAASVEHFQYIIAHGLGDPTSSRRDLARVLLGLGRPAAALEVLGNRMGDPALCRLLFRAAWETARLPLARRAFRCAASVMGKGESIEALAWLIALADRPASVYRQWKGRQGWPSKLRAAAQKAGKILMDLGRRQEAGELAGAAGTRPPRSTKGASSCTETLAARAAFCAYRSGGVRAHPRNVVIEFSGSGGCVTVSGNKRLGRCLCGAAAACRKRGCGQRVEVRFEDDAVPPYLSAPHK